MSKPSFTVPVKKDINKSVITVIRRQKGSSYNTPGVAPLHHPGVPTLHPPDVNTRPSAPPDPTGIDLEQSAGVVGQQSAGVVGQVKQIVGKISFQEDKIVKTN